MSYKLKRIRSFFFRFAFDIICWRPSLGMPSRNRVSNSFVQEGTYKMSIYNKIIEKKDKTYVKKCLC